MRAWLRKQINGLSAFLGHPEPDEPLFDGCAAIVREAADRAAKAGMLDFYEQHKRVRTCTPRDAMAILNSMLAALQPAGDTSAPMTVKQASERYGIPERTLYALCKDGQLVHHRVGTGRGTIRIKPADLDRYLQQNRVEIQSPTAEDLIFGSPD